MGCESFELQIEQRAHGALPPAQQAELAAHLAGCASCRDFAALVSRIEASLVDRVKATLTRVDWARVDREVAVQSFVARWVLMLFGVLPLVSLGVLTAKDPHRPELLVPYGVFAVAVAALCWGMRRRWLQQWERGASEDLLAFYRRWLDQRVRDARQSIATCVGVGLAVPAVVLVGAPPQTVFDKLAVGSAPVVLLGSAVYLAVVHLPRLRRERRAID